MKTKPRHTGGKGSDDLSRDQEPLNRIRPYQQPELGPILRRHWWREGAA